MRFVKLPTDLQHDFHVLIHDLGEEIQVLFDTMGMTDSTDTAKKNVAELNQFVADHGGVSLAPRTREWLRAVEEEEKHARQGD